jgi:hypothetical protein
VGRGRVQQGVAPLVREWEARVPPMLAGDAQGAIVPVDSVPWQGRVVYLQPAGKYQRPAW